MQTLGLSDSMPRSESRLKSLFWPSIQSSSDVDYLGAQGYWVCAVIAVLSFVVLAVSSRVPNPCGLCKVGLSLAGEHHVKALRPEVGSYASA
jgi:hypothetical protein